MKRNEKWSTSFIVAVVGLTLWANYVMAGPTAEMVKEVIDYYYTGQAEGPILTDVKLCTTIADKECEDSIDPNSVPIGQPVKVWMRFLVPKGSSYDDILVEYNYNNTAWRVLPHRIEGAIRYRLVDTYAMQKPGAWTINIKRGSETLKSIAVNVTEN